VLSDFTQVITNQKKKLVILGQLKDPAENAPG